MSRLYEASQRLLEPTVEADACPAVPIAGEAMQRFPLEEGLAKPEEGLSKHLAPLPPKRIGAPHQPSVRIARSNRTDKLITNNARTGAFAEYRRLAATLIQVNPERRGLTMVITSAVPGEGKTLSAANLALTLTEAYSRRVLLVEADMRRPVLGELFGIPVALGFCDCLRAGRVLPAATVAIHGGLTILPAGQPDKDPVGLLSSDRLAAFVADAIRLFDCVVFDTPPAVLLPDAELLSKAVDTTVLVVRAGQTAYEKVQRAVDTIGRERIAGVLLNQVQPGSGHDKEYDDYYTPYNESTSV
jgi:protein-tyrosine kinase